MMEMPTAGLPIILLILAIVPSALTIYGGTYSPSSPPTLQLHDQYFQPDVILRVTGENIAIDCIHRYSVIVNGTVPGPTLTFTEGDQVWIRVYNDLPNGNFTMHWHGLTQRTSPFSDGTPMASQWPIPPLHYFDYELQFETGDAGTYFYHSHVGFNHVTAAGILIVLERAGSSLPYQYDGERIVSFSDFYHDSDAFVESELTSVPFRWLGQPNDFGINGHFRSTFAGPSQEAESCSWALITLQPDKTYRFRFIGGTVLSWVFAAIQDHNMTVIEIDGHYVAALPVSHLEIHSGQRYSVLVKSKSLAQIQADQAAGKTQYWLYAETRGQPLNLTTMAVIAYDLSGTSATTSPVDVFTIPSPSPLSLPDQPSLTGWLEDKFHPLAAAPYDDTVPQLNEVTRRIIVNVTQTVDSGTPPHVIFTQDGYPWFENVVQEPYLVSLYKNNVQAFPNYTAALANGGFDARTRTFPAKIGEVLEIVWQLQYSISGTADTHPWHAHGDHVWDIGTGPGVYDVNTAEALLQNKLANGGPIKRDTTNLYGNVPDDPTKAFQPVSWRAWRLRVKHAAVLMVHCHLVPHMLMGIQTVFVFGEPKDLTPLPQEIAAAYLVYGGGAYGNATFSPRVLHYWHD